MLYRCYYASLNNNNITSYGFNTSVIYGFTNILFKLLRNENPDYCAIVFDSAKPTWRKEIYNNYKATRAKQPDLITESFKYIINIINAFNIKYYQVDGYEADDIIGTIVKKSPSKLDKYIISLDKDYDQLVDSNTYIYRPNINKGYSIIDRGVVLKKWGINDPKQVIDILALGGDKCDNIPGVAHIGPKRAQQLILQYGSVENIIIQINDLDNSIKKYFTKELDNLMLYKKLATINTDAQFAFDIEDCKLRNPNMNALEILFNKFEFNSLLKKLNIRTTQMLPIY